MSGSTQGPSGLDRRGLLRAGAAGVTGGVAVWTAPAILLATPALAATTYIAQYKLAGTGGSWVTTTAPELDSGAPAKAGWVGCQPSGWSTGVSPTMVPPTTVGFTGTLSSGTVTLTAHATCRIKEARATVYAPGSSGGGTYYCQTGNIAQPTWTGNTAVFAALPTSTGDVRLAFRIRLECGS